MVGALPKRRSSAYTPPTISSCQAHLSVVLVPISPRWFSASSLILIPSVWARILMIF